MSEEDGRKRTRAKWLDDRVTRSRDTKKHENRIARKLGGRRKPRSGASAWSPHIQMTDGGDVDTPELYVEHKRTEHASVSVKLSWLEQITEAAQLRHKAPAVVLTFTGGQVRLDKPSSDRCSRDWVMLPLEVVQSLLGLEVD
jgi:hypothetical protein